MENLKMQLPGTGDADALRVLADKLLGAVTETRAQDSVLVTGAILRLAAEVANLTEELGHLSERWERVSQRWE